METLHLPSPASIGGIWRVYCVSLPVYRLKIRKGRLQVEAGVVDDCGMYKYGFVSIIVSLILLHHRITTSSNR